MDAAGSLVRCQKFTNHLTDAAMDVLLNALLSSGNFRVTHLYARFGLNSAEGILPVTANQLNRVNRSNFVTDSGASSGALWVPILAAPAQSSTDPSRFQGNQATFFFRIPGQPTVDQTAPNDLTGEESVSRYQPGSSLIFATGLGVSRDSTDRTQDRIISVSLATVSEVPEEEGETRFEAFLVPANGQVSLDYEFKLETI